jgi:CRP-like cAMP-binding protein
MTDLDALGEAVARFAKERDLLRAITAVKRMMDIAPKDPRTLRAVALVSQPEVRGAPAAITRAGDAPHPREGWQAVALASIPLVQMEAKGERPIVEIGPFIPSEVSDEFMAIALRPEFPVTPLFAGLDTAGFELLFDRLKVAHAPKGQLIFRQGDASRSLYVISEGAVRVFVERPAVKEIARLDAGEFFGEIALITDQARTATVQAIADTDLIEIEPSAISALLLADPHAMQVLIWFLRDRLVDLFVRTNALFQRISHAEGKRLAARFTIIEAKDDALLIEQGARSRGLLIILAGAAEVLRHFGEETVRLATLGPGDVIGEMSLLSKEPAIASVQAKGRFIALELSAERFAELVRLHPDLTSVIAQLAEERRKRFVEIVNGREGYGEGHLHLV